jgi:large subunit ribosomal protein L4
MESPIYNAQGKKTGTINLPESVFGVFWNDALMHQVVTSMQSNARPSVAHTKGRGEVRGGGRKPWQQKGTGRARHGSIRSPIWKGGSVTHGPTKDKNYEKAIPKKMRAKALYMALSRKLKDGEILFVDTFGISEPKTSVAKKSLVALSKIAGFGKMVTKGKNAALITFADPTEAVTKSFRNISNISYVPVRQLNPIQVLGNSYVIIENPEASLAIVESRLKKVAKGAAGEAKQASAPKKKAAAKKVTQNN